jgi:2-polyprenyl-6-methoxyphenol hydroxylase-like FAD-dependent oxidoreductase
MAEGAVREIYDVLQVGYGPVSQALAMMLGRRGYHIVVCERWKTRYPLPRAVCIDHELYRVLSANGMGDVLPGISHPGPLYQWFNADWKELLVIDWSADSISGGAEVNFVHQPTVEETFDRKIEEISSVDLQLGWEVIEVTQDEDLAHVLARQMDTGEEKRLSAKFVIGCDGANSIIRKTIGGEQEDRGFEADWLVIDVLLRNGVTVESLGIPAAGQYCNPERPTTIVPAGVREGRIFRRWEFMRLPGEKPEDLESEERVWELLKPWAGPGQVELVRHKIYNFRSLLAKQWRDGRLIIAGDAAHVMPPFMGQGMCSGFRDAWNLSWKLDLILANKADPRLLDTYQPERFAHVRQLIDMSIYLGKIICNPDSEAAKKRDEAFLSGAAEPPPPFPTLQSGLIARSDAADPFPCAGELSPHVEVRAQGFEGRFDDLVGRGFVVIGLGHDPLENISAMQREQLALLDPAYVCLNSGAGGNGVEDLEGRLLGYMGKNSLAAMIIRPDFYIYGGVEDIGELADLVSQLLRDLEAHGVSIASKVTQAGGPA